MRDYKNQMENYKTKMSLSVENFSAPTPPLHFLFLLTTSILALQFAFS